MRIQTKFKIKDKEWINLPIMGMIKHYIIINYLAMTIKLIVNRKWARMDIIT
jgi:hypothetical protein